MIITRTPFGLVFAEVEVIYRRSMKNMEAVC